jgi:hypothetical protein
MIIEIDQTVQTEINTGQVINIADHRLRTTITPIGIILHITDNNNNIEEMIDEEATHHYHLQLNQEPTVGQTTEDQ